VKYNNFVFWWRVDEAKWGTNFRRYWRFRKAQKEGVFDFYSRVVLLLGGATLLYGFFKGRKQDSAYLERVNSLRLKELDLEIEKLRYEIELGRV